MLTRRQFHLSAISWKAEHRKCVYTDIKELKGRFAQWYNQRHDRYGVLWAERFKSVLLEGGEALAAVAAYIELNPVRASLCADPKD